MKLPRPSSGGWTGTSNDGMSTSARWPTWHLRFPRRRRRNWSCGAPGRSRGRTLLPRRRIEGPVAVAELAWLLAGPGAAAMRIRALLPPLDREHMPGQTVIVQAPPPRREQASRLTISEAMAPADPPQIRGSQVGLVPCRAATRRAARQDFSHRTPTLARPDYALRAPSRRCHFSSAECRRMAASWSGVRVSRSWISRGGSMASGWEASSRGGTSGGSRYSGRAEVACRR